jgi:two-component system, OmpR family, sensor kinase
MSISEPYLGRPAKKARPPRIAHRLTALSVAVATVAVLAIGLTLLLLIRGLAQKQVRAELGRQADGVTSAVAGKPDGLGHVAGVPLGHGVRIEVVTEGASFCPYKTIRVPARIAIPLNQGMLISTVIRISGVQTYVEARPLATSDSPTADGTCRPLGIVLLERLGGTRTLAQVLRAQVFLALGISLLVATIVGTILGRRLAQPIQRMAATVRELALGRRGAESEWTGPTELADIGEAINDLVAGLRQSEDQQRQFLLSVANELRTPLTIVMGNAEAIADGVIVDEGILSSGALMLRESRKLDQSISDLLTLSKRLAADPAAELLLGSLDQWAQRPNP